MSELEFRKDKLVLYLEEELEEDEHNNEVSINHCCFILFDDNEKEYFIAGKRNHDDSIDFKFYIKKVEDVFQFLINIINPTSQIKIILFNLTNLYENAPIYDYHPYLDFKTLDDKSDEMGTVISSFHEDDCENIQNKLRVFLKMLKTVRY
jgi:hypothetical protein